MDDLERLPHERDAEVRRTARHLLLPIAVVALGYYAAAFIGFRLRFPASGISFFWPPTAVLTAALLLSEPRSWGGLLAGAFVAHAAAHAQNGVALQAWPIQFLANALQAVLAAWFVRKYSDPHRPFGNLQRAGAFIVGACGVAPAAASLVVASTYVGLGWAASFLDAWSARAVSNAIAALTLVPPIVMAWPYFRAKPRLPAARRVLEFALLCVGVLVAHSFVRQVDRDNSLALTLALYAPAPFLLWATVRFGGLGLSATVLLTTLLTISSALRGDGAFSHEEPLQAVVGVQLFVAMTAVPLILIAGLLEQSRAEHHALLEMERQNSATLRALPDLLFVQTRDGVYLQYYAKNPTELLAPPASFIGRNMREVLPPELVRKFIPALQMVTMDEATVIEYTLALNGRPHQFEARLIALDGGRVLTVVRDITEQRRSEDALKQANDALVRMGRVSALAELSASIAHELKQPLTAIAANANACLRWLASGAPNADLRGALKDVVADTHRASQIIERTKDMFVNRSVQKATLDLNALVRDVLELTGTHLRKGEVRLETNLDRRVPAVEADAIQIRQVVLNLILNAVDAMLDVHDRIRVLRIDSRRHADGALVTVRDTGSGIDPAAADRLFEPFYTTKADGVGIGLAISRSIVDAHGGRLWAEANPTGGATFRFTLPAAPDEREERDDVADLAHQGRLRTGGYNREPWPR